MPEENSQDKFIAMVSAKANVTLPIKRLSSSLHVAHHAAHGGESHADFPVIDYHNHLDAQDPAEVLKVMDACGIEHIINITMKLETKP